MSGEYPDLARKVAKKTIFDVPVEDAPYFKLERQRYAMEDLDLPSTDTPTGLAMWGSDKDADPFFGLDRDAETALDRPAEQEPFVDEAWRRLRLAWRALRWGV